MSHLHRHPRGAVQYVRTADLRAADSPRRDGIDEEHARLLAASDAVLPPILVARHSLQVIDGMHRLRATQLRGQDTIAVEYADVGPGLAFVLAVQANTTHGLPLRLADRRRAATRILASHPHWSDRAISRVAGLSPGSVAMLRRQIARPPTARSGDGRLGLDGRVRPDDTAARRRTAARVLTKRPDLPLREVAGVAGISPATAHDVRQRLLRGEDPVPGALRARSSGPPPASDRPVARQPPAHDRDAAIQGLARDPSLRFTDSGRAVLRWLRSTTTVTDQCREFSAAVPAEVRPACADLARSYAADWLHFADQLERRAAAGGA
jgi:ParB-like chromosome segregation protein Spo0J